MIKSYVQNDKLLSILTCTSLTMAICCIWSTITAASSLRRCRDCFAKDDDGKMAKKKPKICEYFIDSVLYVELRRLSSMLLQRKGYIDRVVVDDRDVLLQHIIAPTLEIFPNHPENENRTRPGSKYPSPFTLHRPLSPKPGQNSVL